jgi:hypothetical protein
MYSVRLPAGVVNGVDLFLSYGIEIRIWKQKSDSAGAELWRGWFAKLFGLTLVSQVREEATKRWV